MSKVVIEVDAEMIPELYQAMNKRVADLREAERITTGRLKADVSDLIRKVDSVAGALLEKKCQLEAEGIITRL